ncbi:peptidylprolyl isomerase [Paenibacillus sp. IITD108]|uniref:peptidylprolyl isomerase n=1 Tax=Paenibacillus sp. IITD108 TaxID=3116649 RepID=UPI002F3E272B
MKKFELLKVVVIVQAICMIALTGFVIVKLWPVQPTDSGEQIEPVPQDKIEDTGEEKQKIIASVGGENILYEQLIDDLYEQYGDAALRTLMVRKALDMEAVSLGIEVTAAEVEEEIARWMAGYDNEQQFYSVMKEQLGMSRQHLFNDAKYRLLLEKITIAMVDVSSAEVTKYIDDHPELFQPTQQLHLRWIVTETLEKSNDLMSMLESGESFAELAVQYSNDHFTAEYGGDLGLIDATDPFYNKKMLQEASKLNPSEIVGPLETDDGYVIVQLLGRTVTDEMPRSKQQAEARRQLALQRSKPQNKIEDELLQKYDALVVK